MLRQSLVAGLSALAFSSAVSATTVSLRWTGSSNGAVLGLGTNAVDLTDASGPVTLTLDVIIGVDAAGLSAAGLDLEFDTDGLNELDKISSVELSWGNAKATRTLKPLGPGLATSQESESGAAEGQLFGFDLFTLGTGAASVTITFARMVFATDTLRALTDGADIFSTNERDPLATAFFNNASQQLAIAPVNAAVNWVLPEPGTFGLLGIGLASLAVASRRRA